MNNDLYGEINEGIGTGILVTTFIFALATKLLGREPESDEEAEKAVESISDEDRLKLAKEVAQQAIKDMESKMSYEEFADAGMPDTKPAEPTTATMDYLRNLRNLKEIVSEEIVKSGMIHHRASDLGEYYILVTDGNINNSAYELVLDIV